MVFNMSTGKVILIEMHRTALICKIYVLDDCATYNSGLWSFVFYTPNAIETIELADSGTIFPWRLHVSSQLGIILKSITHAQIPRADVIAQIINLITCSIALTSLRREKDMEEIR